MKTEVYEFGTEKISVSQIAAAIVSAVTLHHQNSGGYINPNGGVRLDLYLTDQAGPVLTIEDPDREGVDGYRWTVNCDITFTGKMTLQDAARELLEGLQLSYQSNHDNLAAHD